MRHTDMPNTIYKTWQEELNADLSIYLYDAQLQALVLEIEKAVMRIVTKYLEASNTPTKQQRSNTMNDDFKLQMYELLVEQGREITTLESHFSRLKKAIQSDIHCFERHLLAGDIQGFFERATQNYSVIDTLDDACRENLVNIVHRADMLKEKTTEQAFKTETK